MDAETILACLIVAKELVRLFEDAARKKGYTKEDLDKIDTNRSEAINRFKKAAGIQD